MGDADLLLGQEEALDALLAAVKVFSRRSRLPQADRDDAIFHPDIFNLGEEQWLSRDQGAVALASIV